ncbi:hypothetical protein DL764_005311 [Monosporascus ibericus]|uniref:Uncharacterized protein n=1 Tax=Monosporascus ibericus TaxID=155417 RepID=A0A4Q4TD05_9PEZI|nr:hypothetical protein DL764_005311 [Monosporascus ibericus]
MAPGTAGAVLAFCEGPWDFAVLSHYIWYFESSHALRGILPALKGRVKGECATKYALHATERAMVAHVLAVLARAMVASYKSDSDKNVRKRAGPSFIKASAELAG